MKRFIQAVMALACVAVFAVSVPAAQYETTTTSLTNTVAAATTNTVNTGSFTCTKYGEVAVTVAAALTAAGTANTEIVLSSGVDGTTYNGPTYTILLAQTGTISTSTTTNIDVGALGYLRVKTLGNPDADGVLTNVTVGYTVKPNRLDGQ